ncbi:MAG: glutaminyl-peptide cyclotransferase, partial [Pyrinomonadaceae bacterium]
RDRNRSPFVSHYSMKNLLLVKTSLAIACLLGCGSGDGSPAARKAVAGPDADRRVVGDRPAEKPVAYTYEIKNVYPHDRAAFTQGLLYKDGVLWEGTGQYGASSLRKVDLKSGRVIKMVSVPSEFFGEGITVFKDKVFQLTWQNHKGFIYSPGDFVKTGEFKYAGEGWGLTHDSDSLIMSDGTNQIRFLDPETFAVRRTVSVTEQGRPVSELNELEYVRGEIYANVWQTDRLVRIDPKTGSLTGTVDLAGLLPEADRDADTDVLNGIAYDEAGDRLFVTGKLWSKLFEIRLIKK